MSERDLEGKVALVTGGSRGIGRAISEGLARRGANVVIAYLRKRAAAEETCRALDDHGVKALSVRCNVGDAGEVDELFGLIGEAFGRLDVFVSNAASGVIRPLEELDCRAWDWTMDINARPPLLAARYLPDLMPEGGSVVALSSLGASRVMPGYAVVGASKAALEAVIRYLAVELGPRRIRSNVVSAGVVDTDALKHFPMREAMLDVARTGSPVGRLVTPADVAATVDFLTSDRATMINGQTIVLDGGASLLVG